MAVAGSRFERFALNLENDFAQYRIDAIVRNVTTKLLPGASGLSSRWERSYNRHISRPLPAGRCAELDSNVRNGEKQ
jgi:hypothetical protein